MLRNAKRMTVGLLMVLGLNGCAQQGVAGTEAAARRESLRAQLADLFAAYEAEDYALVESRFDRNMVGYQRLIDGVRADFDRNGQIRVLLTDTEYAMEQGAAVVSTRFEKRSVRTADSGATMVAGRATILLRQSGNDWIITSISGDSPFAAPVGSQ